MDTRNYSCC